MVRSKHEETSQYFSTSASTLKLLLQLPPIARSCALDENVLPSVAGLNSPILEVHSCRIKLGRGGNHAHGPCGLAEPLAVSLALHTQMLAEAISRNSSIGSKRARKTTRSPWRDRSGCQRQFFVHCFRLQHGVRAFPLRAGLLFQPSSIDKEASGIRDTSF